MSGGVAVEARNLAKHYKTARAVDGIDIQIPAGVCCGFLGKNGAGKTTTLKMLVGLKKPTSGEIAIMGTPQRFGTHSALDFGYLPDVPNFYGYMTGAEFLTFCTKLHGIDAGARKAKVQGLLDKVGLSRARSTIAGYSRGMKQRLGIAQALINDPKVLFMDEPISALDPIGRRDVTEIIRGLKQGGDTTVILSTHILADVEDVCDYVLIIEQGKIMAQDYLADLKAKYRRDEAEIRFYDTETAKQFEQAAGGTGLLWEAVGAVSYAVRMDEGSPSSPQLLSRRITELLHAHSLPAESCTAHNPTLEEIFYAVIHG
jgi:ABC-2 type transport system ATP-binding protein